MNNPIFDEIESISQLDITNYQYFHNLLERRTILFNSDISESIIESVFMPLKEFESDDNPNKVTLILNTLGGSVADGLMLCNVIDVYAKPLDIIVPSYSCSMGTIILCSGNNNPNVTKYCYPFSFALFHSGQIFLGGETNTVDDVREFNKQTDAKIRDYILNNTKVPAELYDQNKRTQWYLCADDMLKYGLVDKIIGCDK